MIGGHGKKRLTGTDLHSNLNEAIAATLDINDPHVVQQLHAFEKSLLPREQ